MKAVRVRRERSVRNEVRLTMLVVIASASMGAACRSTLPPAPAPIAAPDRAIADAGTSHDASPADDAGWTLRHAWSGPDMSQQVRRAESELRSVDGPTPFFEAVRDR